MNGRLTTSLEVERKIIELQKILKLSTKASVMRLAIGLSLRSKSDPRLEYPEVENDHGGATYQKITITGDYDEFYKALLTEQIGKKISDDKLFPELFNAHISRGIDILYDEYQLKGSYDKVIESIFTLI